MKRHTPNLPLFLLAIFLLSSCASTKEPSFGDQLSGQGVAMNKIGQQWTKGDDSIVAGNKLVRDGEKQIERGEATVKKGEAMIKKGKRLKDDAEQEYQNSTGVPAKNIQY